MSDEESGQGAVITSPAGAVTAVEDLNACVGIAREMEHLAVAMDRAIADRSAAVGRAEQEAAALVSAAAEETARVAAAISTAYS